MNRRGAVLFTLCLLLTLPVQAQGPSDDWTPQYIAELGICQSGLICGPSGALIIDRFPTIIDIDWAAFPANPLRPHQPTNDGRVWYVAADGHDENSGDQGRPLATIDRALEMAQPGDVIQVADGEYPIGLYEDSLIMATPGVTLAAEQVGGAVLVPASDEWLWLPAITARADNLVIDGFVIRGFTDGYGVLFGRLDSPQRHLVLRHLLIDGAQDGIRSEFPGTPANPQPVVEGMLLYDIAIRNTMIGFNCGEGPCDDVRMEALSIDLSTETAVDSGSWGDGVAFENGDNNVVFNAEITGTGADGLDFKSTRVAVANVRVHDVGRNGIKLWNDGDIINALVYNTGADASIVFDGGGTYRILNSTIARHAVGESAYLGTVAYDNPTEPGSLQIINTIFYENAGALWVSDAFELDIRRSLFYGAGNSENLIWRSLRLTGNEDDAATLEAAGGGCCGLFTSDPGFLNPDAGIYELAEDTPAVDAGLTEGLDALPPFDLYGRPRVEGEAIDLGPFEMEECCRFKR